jgi:hypothetical protein
MELFCELFQRPYRCSSHCRLSQKRTQGQRLPDTPHYNPLNLLVKRTHCRRHSEATSTGQYDHPSKRDRANPPCRVFSQREMQWKWNAWLQIPQATVHSDCNEDGDQQEISALQVIRDVGMGAHPRWWRMLGSLDIRCLTCAKSKIVSHHNVSQVTHREALPHRGKRDVLRSASRIMNSQRSMM